jgi:hypothetical protein
MSKLIYVTNVSLDGYIEDERGTPIRQRVVLLRYRPLG